uniref:Uncharacterized protein n=1 Tax=Octopus bimaculoides TaxID=37653 RepID=A0A0L8HF73_OCTBM
MSDTPAWSKIALLVLCRFASTLLLIFLKSRGEVTFGLPLLCFFLPSLPSMTKRFTVR